MVRYTALIFALALALFGCGKEEMPCDPSCGTLRDKRIDFHFMQGNAYRYIIDRDCTGERFTYTGRSSEPYNSLLIGDRVCTDEIN
jgi:hypothetical protein